MKRKFKLFATLASLCLSVALMAFGVYAASTSTYNVTSSVAFVSQVAVTWSGSVSGDIANIGNADPAVGTAQDSQQVLYTYTEKGSNDYANNSTYADRQWQIGEVKFAVQTDGSSEVVYTINCLNESTNNIDVKVTDITSQFSNSATMSVAVTSTVAKAVDANSAVGTAVCTSATALTVNDGATGLAPGETVTLTIRLTLNDYTKTFNGGSGYAMNITLSAAASSVN